MLARNVSNATFIRSKGLTEAGLANLGYADTIIFRPGFLAGVNRERTSTGEMLYG